MTSMNFVGSLDRVYRSICLMSMVSVICNGSRSPILRTHRRGYLSMSVTSGVIIGGGRIGSYLHESNGKNDVLLSSRDAAFPESSASGPIYICTRNDDLDAIIEKTPLNRREDLVFLQNGMLGPYLAGKGLTMNTQGFIMFSPRYYLASHVS